MRVGDDDDPTLVPGQEDATVVVHEPDDATVQIPVPEDVTVIIDATDDATVLRQEPEDVTVIIDGPDDDISKVQLDYDKVSATGTAALTEQESPRKKARRLLALIAICILAISCAAWVAHSLYKRPPDSVSAEQPGHDAYREALILAEDTLNSGDATRLPALLVGLVRQQPGNADMEALLEDATHYRNMLYLKQAGRLLELAEARQARPMHTALFAEASSRHLDVALGSAATVEGLSAAAQAWRSGELVDAINAVKQLSSESGNQQAAGLLSHYSKVVSDYERLSQLQDTPGYSPAMLSFYLELDPWRDQFFWNRLAKDAQSVANREEVRYLQRAGSLWVSYRSNGGIDGTITYAVGSDNAFRDRAGELAQAHKLVSQVVNMLRESAVPGADQTPLFQASIMEEIRVQRERLLDLQRLNDEAVIASRLLLLPRPESP